MNYSQRGYAVMKVGSRAMKAFCAFGAEKERSIVGSFQAGRSTAAK